MINLSTNTFVSLPRAVRAHCIRTSVYARMIAEQTDKFCQQYDKEMLNDMLSAIMDGGLYHDIGKILISNSILQKEGELSDIESEVFRCHPLKTEEILLQNLERSGENAEYKQIVIEMGKYHHERYDGEGYPFGLSGDEIPLPAQICSIANTFERLLSVQNNKKSKQMNTVEQSIVDCSGSKFDPYIVDCFLKAVPKMNDLNDRTQKRKK